MRTLLTQSNESVNINKIILIKIVFGSLHNKIKQNPVVKVNFRGSTAK